MINHIHIIIAIALLASYGCEGYEPSSTGAYKESQCATCLVTNPALPDKK